MLQFNRNCLWGIYAFRGAFKLELRCPQKVDGIALDPEPDWSFGALLSEIDELERKINSSSKVSVPFTKERPRYVCICASVCL